MFSGALEEERNHPAFVEISQKSIALFEEIIVFCQSKGQLPAGRVEVLPSNFGVEFTDSRI